MIPNIGEVVDLRMAVMTRSDTICSLGLKNLLGLEAAVLTTRFRQSRLEETTAAAAAIVIGSVGRHVDEVLFPNDFLDHVAQVLSDRITKRFSHQLTRVLNGKFNFAFFVPIGINFELSIPDPPGVKPDDALYLEVVGNIEFFQSGPDCK